MKWVPGSQKKVSGGPSSVNVLLSTSLDLVESLGGIRGGHVHVFLWNVHYHETVGRTCCIVFSVD